MGQVQKSTNQYSSRPLCVYSVHSCRVLPCEYLPDWAACMLYKTLLCTCQAWRDLSRVWLQIFCTNTVHNTHKKTQMIFAWRELFVSKSVLDALGWVDLARIYSNLHILFQSICLSILKKLKFISNFLLLYVCLFQILKGLRGKLVTVQ